MPYVKLMRHISFVFQNVYLFDDSIINNIRVGNRTCSEEELEQAIRLAAVDEMRERLPLGLDTPVGEGGTALSGGERQRVAIARAIIKKSPVLLLDEVTSSLDAHNQQAVRDTIALLRKTHTILIIAHRLQTITRADHILVLNAQGRIEQSGTHAELLGKEGTYREFWDLRRTAQGWRL
jgi:ATP-binding cassette subfamily B protein